VLNTHHTMQEQGFSGALLEHARAIVAPDGFANSAEDWQRALDEYTSDDADVIGHRHRGDAYMEQFKQDFQLERTASCGEWTPGPR
jgi:alpha-beta hydrolase superfamily lysophospholipase